MNHWLEITGIMANQELVVIQDFLFYFQLNLRNLQFLEKGSFLEHFIYFSSKAEFFDIIHLNFQKIHEKIKSLHNVKVSYRTKTLKILVPGIYRIVISRKTKCFGIFCLFFHKNIIF